MQDCYREIGEEEGKRAQDNFLKARYKDIHQLEAEAEQQVPKFLEGTIDEEQLTKRLNKIKNQREQARQVKDLTKTCEHLKVAKKSVGSMQEELNGDLDHLEPLPPHESKEEIRVTREAALENTQDRIKRMKEKIAKRGDEQ